MVPPDHPAPCTAPICRPALRIAPLPAVDPLARDVRRRRAARRAAGGRAADPDAASRIAAVVFDVGGVVIPSLFESVMLTDFPAGPLADEGSWREVQEGRVSERAYWRAVAAERPGIDIAALWRRCSAVRDELRGALDRLAARVRLIAFTNDMSHFFGDDWVSRFPELSVFDAIVEASSLRVAKPDPDAFRAAARAVGERPERCLLVDDLAVNVAGAALAGMRTRLFDVRDPAGSIAAVLDEVALRDAASPLSPRAFQVTVSPGAPR